MLANASIDYGRVLELTDSWRRRPLFAIWIPAPALMAFRTDEGTRPVWITPYYWAPFSGQLGVMADDGTRVNQITLDEAGLRRRPWYE